MTVLGDLISPAQLDKCGTRDFPVLSMTMHDGIMLQSERFKKSLASIDQSAYKVVQRNQLVVGFPIDEGVLYIQKVVDAGIMSPAYDVWNVKQDIVNLDYLELSLHSPQSMLYYRTNLRGSTARRRSLPKEILLSLPVKLPDMESQRRVVIVIAKVKDIILLYKRLLSALDNLIKARFVEMFGDPETNPKGWEQVTLGDVCSSIVRGPFGSALKKEFFVEPNDTTYKVYEQKHAIQKSAVIGTYYVTSEKYNELKRFKCVAGDIIMSCSGTMGELYQLPEGCERGIINQALCKFTLNERILPICFLTYMRETIGNLETKGSGIQNIAAVSYVKAMPINLPPMDVQQQFASFVSQINKSKSIIQKSLDETQLLFDSLMQQYFG